MKIVVAPNALKGSLSAKEASIALAAGAQRAVPDGEVRRLPLSDGGDGFIEVMSEALGGELRVARVQDPLGRWVEAPFLWIEEQALAVIEMAKASGLTLLGKEERDPTRTTTAGTGQLVAAALDLKPRQILVGLGGSATCDGGTGLAVALGVRFMDEEGRLLTPMPTGLGALKRIDLSGLDPRLSTCRVEGVCDVENPLLGPHGAAAVFGPQKGASLDQVRAIEASLKVLARVLHHDLGIEVASLAKGGAAGGLGAGLRAFLGATLRSGMDTVLDLIGFDGAIQDVDLVLTAEGRVDDQTLCGKAPLGAARRALRGGVPCVVVAGAVCADRERLRQEGFTASFSLLPEPMDAESAMALAAPLLETTACEVVRLFATAAKGLS